MKQKVLRSIQSGLATGVLVTLVVIYILGRLQLPVTPLAILETFLLSFVVGVIAYFMQTPRSHWGQLLLGFAMLAVLGGTLAIAIILAVHK